MFISDGVASSFLEVHAENNNVDEITKKETKDSFVNLFIGLFYQN